MVGPASGLESPTSNLPSPASIRQPPHSRQQLLAYLAGYPCHLPVLIHRDVFCHPGDQQFPIDHATHLVAERHAAALKLLQADDDAHFVVIHGRPMVAGVDFRDGQ
jgi:hypothetical protein